MMAHAYNLNILRTLGQENFKLEPNHLIIPYFKIKYIKG